MEATTRRRSLQERFESTPLGRIVISIFLLVTFVALLTANLPESRLQELLLKADHPYVYGLGLDQAWGVFAPDPRSQTINVPPTCGSRTGRTRRGTSPGAIR
jgi:hypothetical protein